ncbi:helix-turn-helix domain-containing protein [Lactobacillus kefiranofaciens]|uniref:helix-turn-helix domain-containing protein n=1 Tax=Lactobacillus kefiranofaciens TaxID=267818 RepID=UPI000BA54C37|nr:helix-turn-helix transcriptional regulator [Lactobacillus kefiranofaciens]
MKRRNSKIDKIVGPKFKEIRKEAQVSLNELAQKVGVVSPSTLSRWERGEEGLPVEIFEKLLTSMNISYDEIVASEVDIKEIIAQVELAYQTNDIKELKRISLDLLAKYDQTGDGLLKTEYLLKYAIAANYYLDLSGDDLTNTEYKTKLSEQFIDDG